MSERDEAVQLAEEVSRPWVDWIIGRISEEVKACDQSVPLDSQGCKCMVYIRSMLEAAITRGARFAVSQMAERPASLDPESERPEHVGATLYRRRCGWCGAYAGTVDPTEPCAKDHNTGEYIGPHHFGVYEQVEAELPEEDR